MKIKEITETISTEQKQRLDPKCWKGYRKQGTKIKGGVRVNNCVPVKESETEYEHGDFSIGDRVKLKPEYEDNPGEVFTITQDNGRKFWIEDEDGRGWYVSAGQIVPAEDNDYLDEGESKMNNGDHSNLFRKYIDIIDENSQETMQLDEGVVNLFKNVASRISQKLSPEAQNTAISSVEEVLGKSASDVTTADITSDNIEKVGKEWWEEMDEERNEVLQLLTRKTIISLLTGLASVLPGFLGLAILKNNPDSIGGNVFLALGIIGMSMGIVFGMKARRQLRTKEVEWPFTVDRLEQQRLEQQRLKQQRLKQQQLDREKQQQLDREEPQLDREEPQLDREEPQLDREEDWGVGLGRRRRASPVQ